MVSVFSVPGRVAGNWTSPRPRGGMRPLRPVRAVAGDDVWQHKEELPSRETRADAFGMFEK